jgi:hypothetical protein
VAGLLPRIDLEPPAGYVRFVEDHLDHLRQDARRLVGDGPDAVAVCSDVLTDVALRWWWFELLRAWFARADPAGGYLGGAVARRVARLRSDPDEMPLEVWGEGSLPPGPPPPGPPRPPAPRPPARPRPSTSVAVRTASLWGFPTLSVSAATEAVIGWIHAHAMYLRYRRVAQAVAALIVAMVLARLRGSL